MKTFPVGTVVRCADCDARGPAVMRVQTHYQNPLSWRSIDYQEHPSCGHKGYHVVFNKDLRQVKKGSE